MLQEGGNVLRGVRWSRGVGALGGRGREGRAGGKGRRWDNGVEDNK